MLFSLFASCAAAAAAATAPRPQGPLLMILNGHFPPLSLSLSLSLFFLSLFSLFFFLAFSTLFLYIYGTHTAGYTTYIHLSISSPHPTPSFTDFSPAPPLQKKKKKVQFAPQPTILRLNMYTQLMSTELNFKPDDGKRNRRTYVHSILHRSISL